MSSWAQRMHRRAATFGSVVTSCGHPGTPYPHRLEKVKFGVPLEEVCKNDIPGPLLVLILKLNKEAPFRKDVFRAPGNQGAMKKLIHFLQQGRLVNVDNYSVYTIASVLKKFLRKIPGGVFGRDGEAELFQIVDLVDEVQQQEKIHKLLMSLPGHTQRLLVLLFGTFRVIASNSERAETGMTSEALGVSVAPSFFQSCVSDGKTARMKDVLRFKVATKIMKQMIEQFAACDLFGRVNYEYYARVTGRVLRVQDEWICSFRYPPPPRGKTAQQHYALQLALETEKTWLQCECVRWGLIAQEESHSTPALLTTGGPNVGNSAVSLGIIPEHSLLESCARLSVSLEGPGIFNVPKGSCSSSSHSSSSTTRSGSQHHMTLDELRAVNRYAESTKSLSYLPQVHERQAARMRTRSEWFLGARGSSLELCHDGTGSLIHPQIVTSTPIPGAVGHHHHPHGIIGTYASIDNLNDIVVVVDVNQDQPPNQYHHNPNNGHNHRQYSHSHEHDHPHESPELLHPSCSHNNVPSSLAPRTTTNKSVENGAAGEDRRRRSHPYERRDHPPPNGGFVSHSSAVERRQKARSRVASGKQPAEEDAIHYWPHKDDDDDADMLADQDELDGDEHDFAISQSHHFDMRAENRRRRRRRALLGRGSYDQLVSSGAIPPGGSNDCCPANVPATENVASGSRTAGGSSSERPSSAPAASFAKSAKKGKLSSKIKLSSRRQSPPPTAVVVAYPTPDESNRISTDNSNTPGTTVLSATTSGAPSGGSNSSHPYSPPQAKGEDPATSAIVNRHKRNSTTGSLTHHSITLGGNGSTSMLPSRQSNLSMIVFSVLDFLF
ncbi:Rho GTPase-activating protein 20 [Anopheles sinensis]|uniref:Rho GTPase-activating protein 20 n=1 Tax=Anopheles sinensis TaxID=74873 RepID=A0A084WMA9_ANOSI|nr:Rho GTPase-activating protein 20 [Anopheles sinensis]